MNLVAVNLVACTLLLPLLMVDTLMPELMSRESHVTALCRTTRSLWFVFSSASMFSQLLIAIDQHLAVVQSLHYHTRINERRCVAMSVSAWVVSIGLGALVATAPSCSASNVWFNSCQNVSEESGTSGGEVQLVIASIIGFVIPLLGIVCIYSRIFCEARLNSERTRLGSIFDLLSHASATNRRHKHPQGLRCILPSERQNTSQKSLKISFS